MINIKTVRTKANPNNDVTPLENENRNLAREAAAESIVLLANNGTLPMAPCTLALFGAGAATTIKGGTGSGEVNERYSVSIEQGLINAGFTITTGKWLRDYEALLKTEEEKFRKALAKKMLSSSADDRINFMSEGFQYPFGRKISDNDISAECGVCIYVIARQAGESSDRKLDKFEFDLSRDEIDNIKIAASAFDKTILIINTGAPVDISFADDIAGLDAIIYFCQQGMEGGNALADIVTGAVSPSGCLTATWSKKYSDIPNAMEYSYLKGHTDYEEYREGIYVGYRYFESFMVKPAYEFGYGLTYPEFDISVTDVIVEGSIVSATIDVTNSGDKYSGKKVAQLYVSAPGRCLNREYQSLAAFGKTNILAPGESQSITLRFDITSLAGYDSPSASYVLEKGDYIVRVGGSCANTSVAAVISLDESMVTEICMNICPMDKQIDEIIPHEESACGEGTSEVGAGAEGVIGVGANAASAGSVFGDAIRLTMHASEISVKTHNYTAPRLIFDVMANAGAGGGTGAGADAGVDGVGAESDGVGAKSANILRGLSTKEMLQLVLGTGMFDSKPFFKVPGAAAHTTSRLVKKGVPNTALCDGPAGLRLQRTSVRYRNGNVKPVDTAMRLHDSMPKVVKWRMYGDLKKGAPLYQYASAFPVGTALAQTWNTELIERIGSAIGAEMVEYGVTFWLAPGMNIQRNPLCGRNFEYYSEDPLLTGKIAAAITRGVQSHTGCYVTIKHYAGNNQETNRNKSNSIMSERTLREIYLKGFRIAVEEGGAKAVMTSYNKVNGVYTPNSYDLCTNVLRCEWGFNGVVMTDWFSTGNRLAGNGLAIKAGNDLIMPGGRAFKKMLKTDLSTGVFSGDDLLLSSARILEAVLNSRIADQLEE